MALCGNCKYLVPEYRFCNNPQYALRGAKYLILKYDEKGRLIRHEFCKQPEKRGKYGAHKVKDGDMTFDSEWEYERFKTLLLLEKVQCISNLKAQVKYELIPKSQYGRAIYYIADFVYNDKAGNLIVEDTKSDPTKTPLYRLKKRLLAEKYGIIIKEVCKE